MRIRLFIMEFEINVTIRSVISREMFWHVYAKIPRHTSKNVITEGDFKYIFACNCEGTEQLQLKTTYRANRKLQESRRKPAEGIILSGVRKNGQDCNRMALWRIPTMGAEGESRSVICESLRQKDSVKNTKEKRKNRSCFCISSG